MPDLGDGVGGVGEDTKNNAHSHDDQADAEQGIDLADDLINGKEGCDEIVDQNDDQPAQRRGNDARMATLLEQRHDQPGGADSKPGADHAQRQGFSQPASTFAWSANFSTYSGGSPVVCLS